jgi:DNA gyrase/topoisomerase IV subunit A
MRDLIGFLQWRSALFYRFLSEMVIEKPVRFSMAGIIICPKDTPMTFSEKIDEWIREAETRPGSALMILKLVANRLRDLSERNEELLAENIALQNGTRVEEYQKRIVHLEYQLEMLKRRFGADGAVLAETPAQAVTLNLLVYNAQGRIFRLEVGSEASVLGRITGELSTDGELPRLLAVPADEEVLLLFSSGRISTLPVAGLPTVDAGGEWDWAQAAMPDEPHAGELLTCLMPLSRLPLSDLVLQASRRGCVKKTMTSLAQTVLSNRYLGRGAIQKADQPFSASLCQKKERFALVTSEGRLLGLDVDDLSYAAEERIRLDTLDYVVASFNLAPGESLLCLTQTGKAVIRDGSSLEVSKSTQARGQALISPSRLEQGTRFIGAVAIKEADKVVVLDADGKLTVYLAGDVAGAGSIHTGALILSIGVVPATA